ncbi:hypothetical protein MHU86_17061 [Fragilaria crotonensis]|nr:hypothetical protein MHU86_17061 [Fragilaria crotonensis]
MQWKQQPKLLIVLAIILCVVVVFPLPLRHRLGNNIIAFFTKNNDDANFCDNDTTAGILEYEKDSFCHKLQQQQEQQKQLQLSDIDNGNNHLQERLSLSPSLSLPLDATYETSLSIPWIGDYTVQMMVLSDRHATLTVGGDYSLQDVFQYQLLTVVESITTAAAQSLQDSMKHRAKDIQFSVELSEYLTGILKHFTVSLATIRYNPRDEIVSVMVSMLHIITFPVKLWRTN